MHTSSGRLALNSCALAHWVPPFTNDINPTVLACLYGRFSVIYVATLSALIWVFTYLSPGQDISKGIPVTLSMGTW